MRLIWQVRDDVTVLLDQVMLPVLEIVRDAASAYRKDALVLMGMLSASHPASAVGVRSSCSVDL